MVGGVFKERILSLRYPVTAERHKNLPVTDNSLAHKNVPRHGENIKLNFQPYKLTVYRFWSFWIKG
jgi:hypothetical protein